MGRLKTSEIIFSIYKLIIPKQKIFILNNIVINTNNLIYTVILSLKRFKKTNITIPIIPITKNIRPIPKINLKGVKVILVIPFTAMTNSFLKVNLLFLLLDFTSKYNKSFFNQILLKNILKNISFSEKDCNTDIAYLLTRR